MKALRKAILEEKAMLKALGKPTAPASVWALYVKDHFLDVQTKGQKKGQIVLAPAVMEQMASKWSSLDERAKDKYQARRDKLKDGYQKELKAWESNMSKEEGRLDA